MKKVIFRVIVGLAVPLALVAGCLYVFRFGNPVPCRFYALTGWYCIGCGSGRAAQSILHGDFSAAFAYNPMLFLMGIPASCVLAWEYIRFVFLPGHLRSVSVPNWMAYSVLIILVLYWILRNIPAFAF